MSSPALLTTLMTSRTAFFIRRPIITIRTATGAARISTAGIASMRFSSIHCGSAFMCRESSMSGRASPTTSPRSEEHTSELQSRLHLVCRLLLEKKKPHARLTHRQPHLSSDRHSLQNHESPRSHLHTLLPAPLPPQSHSAAIVLGLSLLHANAV